MRPTNLLFIISDQHSRDFCGAYGHPQVQTPNIDRLAQNGTRFANAYTNCPICVPARASLATGRYVHDIGHWDNGFPYSGNIPSWHHRMRQQGIGVESIGKLHFRGPQDDNGFVRETEPLHVVDGVGDILGCIRDDPPLRKKHGGITGAGPGDSTYLQYDARNADNACHWLAKRDDDKPWALFLSLVCPHPPYTAPPDLFDLYDPATVPLQPQWHPETWPDHPALDYLRRFFDFSRGFDEEAVRRVTATYYAVCTYLDRQIGRVLNTLEAQNLAQDTRIVYTSDHGECLGARGIFGKFTMYEESAAVPMILAGPDVPKGKTVKTPVSLVDCFPTAMEAVGAQQDTTDTDLPGQSLWDIATQDDRPRTVFSEYHAVGSRRGYYMVCDGHYKYIHYVDAPPQLFDLAADPREELDLAAAPAHADTRQRLEAELRAILDPEATDDRARAAQKAKVEEHGGEAAVRARGAFENSPAPGETPAFVQY
jgi:choline-sulfatase